MSISVYTNQNKVNNGIYGKEDQKGVADANYEIGDVVEGVVTKVTDQILVQVNDKLTTMETEQLPNAKEGDLLCFKVVGKTKEGNSILQHIKKAEEKNLRGAARKTTILRDSVKELSPNQEDHQQVGSAKKKFEAIKQGMSQKDYKDLNEEGFSLEKYDAERFDRALERIKEQREFKEEIQKESIQNVKDERKRRENEKVKQIDDPVMRKQAVELLTSGNLPTNSQNVLAVVSAMNMANEAMSLSEDAMSYLLKNELAFTPKNIYFASYNAKGIVSEPKDAQWETVLDQAEQMVTSINQSGVLASMEDAKWLFQHDIDITAENVSALQALRNLKENFDANEVMSTIISGMATQEACDVCLTDGNQAILAQAIETAGEIAEETIVKTIGYGMKLTLANLKRVQEGIYPIDHHRGDKGMGSLPMEKELKLMHARLQLEEIRVKLTYETGAKLAAKGLHVYSDSIEEIASGLRSLEDEYYQKLLGEAGVVQTDEKLDLLKSTLEVRQVSMLAPSNILGMRFEERNQLTFAEFGTLAKEATSMQKAAEKEYEALMTSPRADYGDDIRKAFASMDSLLREMGIEPTAANRRAVRILSYNQMELSEANIEKMKDYDRMVTGVLKDMKPSTVVEMIRNEKNPMNLTMQELRKQIDEIQAEYGVSEEERYSNYLVKLQKASALTESERNTYIGVYRLLRQVEKSDGKAIGYLVNSGRDITLSNLLSAVRSTKGPGIDASIDDAFGTLESVKSRGKSISEQIAETFHSLDSSQEAKKSYHGQLIKELYQEATPEFLNYADKKIDLMNISIEELVERKQEYEALYPQSNLEGYEQLMNQIREVSTMTEEMQFLKDTKEKLSISNLIACRALRSKGDKVLGGIMEDISPELRASLVDSLEKTESYDDFQKRYEKNVEMTLTQLRNQFNLPKLKVEDAVASNEFIRHMELLRGIQKSQYYQVPLEVNGKIMGVGLSVNQTSENKSEVSIHMHTESFGRLQADLKLSGRVLKGLVVCENQSQLALLDRVVADAKDSLPSIVESVQIHTCLQNHPKENYVVGRKEGDQPFVQVEALFQIARTLIAGIKKIDEM